VLVASLPYAMLVAAVLMGKHIDKLDADSAKGIHTLPVILGRERATFLTQQLLVGFFVFVACLVLVGTLGVWTLLSLLAVPRLWQAVRVLGHPPPASAPPGYPLWPLWYVAWAFRVTRSAGGFLALGLLIDAIYPVHLA
jgi:1,4-dihydroxy-2-naphthoate octaprenyltransferase